MSSDINNKNEFDIRSLIDDIRSDDATIQRRTISKIPTIIQRILEHKDDVLEQVILLIYNLQTQCENFELLNATNTVPILRSLLRLYTDKIQDHDTDQLNALVKMINYIHSPELLSELAYVFYRCSSNSSSKNTIIIEQGLDAIKEKAAAELSPKALLIIHSILAIK